MKLSKGTRRFLVIWFCIHFFALMANLANLDWYFETKRTLPLNPFDVSLSKQFGRTATPVTITYNIYFFTIGRLKGSSMDIGSYFWPFVKFYDESNFTRKYFLGIFHEYDYTEFAFYCILPFVIIGLKRLWH
jgi:hypothetical protein